MDGYLSCRNLEWIEISLVSSSRKQQLCRGQGIRPQALRENLRPSPSPEKILRSKAPQQQLELGLE